MERDDQAGRQERYHGPQTGWNPQIRVNTGRLPDRGQNQNQNWSQTGDLKTNTGGPSNQSVAMAADIVVATPITATAAMTTPGNTVPDLMERGAATDITTVAAAEIVDSATQDTLVLAIAAPAVTTTKSTTTIAEMAATTTRVPVATTDTVAVMETAAAVATATPTTTTADTAAEMETAVEETTGPAGG